MFSFSRTDNLYYYIIYITYNLCSLPFDKSILNFTLYEIKSIIYYSFIKFGDYTKFILPCQ